ncbi:unnamed protein product [Cochlearia groenlandica]
MRRKRLEKGKSGSKSPLAAKRKLPWIRRSVEIGGSRFGEKWFRKGIKKEIRGGSDSARECIVYGNCNIAEIFRSNIYFPSSMDLRGICKEGREEPKERIHNRRYRRSDLDIWSINGYGKGIFSRGCGGSEKILGRRERLHKA